MSPTLYKIILLGVPALILVIGLTVGIWFIVRSSREEKKNKNSISGFVFYHPLRQAEEGCLGKIIDHEPKSNWPVPTGTPFWMRFKWYMPKTPFFFFQEQEETVKAEVTIPDGYKCTCGAKFDKPMALQAHVMWNPHRKIDNLPAVREEWAKLHSKLAAELKPVTSTEKPSFKYVNYEPTDGSVILTPFDIFDLNNWDCQREFHKRRVGNWEKAINMGAGVVLACVCLFVSFVVISEVQKKPPAEQPTQATLEIQK